MFGHALRCLRPAGSQWTWLCVAGLAVALQFAPPRLSFAATPEPEDTRASLANEIFKGRPLADGTGLVSIEMPAILPRRTRTTRLPTWAR